MKNLYFLIFLMGMIITTLGQHRNDIIPAHLSHKAEKYRISFDENSEMGTGQKQQAALFLDDVAGTTFYDLQSYYSLQNRMHVWPDGSIGLAWVMGFQYPNWSDLGSGYNYYDGSIWGTQTGQIVEPQSSSGTNYSSFGSNGEIVLSHHLLNDWQLSFYYRGNRGEGPWQNFTLEGPDTGIGIAWASLMVNGADNKTLHVNVKTTSSYSGQGSAFLYSRSQDGGNTWDILHQYFPELGPDHINNIPRDCYSWAQPLGDTIAFTAGFTNLNGYVMKSYDNGDNWERITVYENPFSPYGGGETPDFGAGDGTSSIALDSDGNAHVVFGRMVYYYDNLSTLYYYPDSEGLIYWNESMEVLDTTTISSYTLDYLEEGGHLIGWIPDFQPLVGWGTYYVSLTSWPKIIIDDNNWIFVTYSGVAPTFDNGSMNFRHIYCNSSIDGGESWNGMIDMNTDLLYLFSECIFPGLAPSIHDSHLHLFFQEDVEPGLYVMTGQQTNVTDNNIIYMKENVYNIPGIENNELKLSGKIQLMNYPNPFRENTILHITMESPGKVNLGIFDVSGKHIKTIDLGFMNSGNNVYNFSDKELKPGTYFYNLSTDKASYQGKFMVQ